MSPAKLAAMTTAFLRGASYEQIARTSGMCALTAQRWLKPTVDLMLRYGERPYYLAKADGHRKPITTAQKTEILSRLSTAFSLRQIAQEMDLDPMTVGNYARPFIAEMREAGTLGVCDCGKARFHPGACPRTSRPPVSEDQLRRRIEVSAAIMTGATFGEIAEKLGIRSTEGVRYHLRYLTSEQRERRKALERARRRDSAAPPFRPFRDDTYAKFAALMPRWLSDAARDDAISDMYLAHLEGGVSMKDLPAEAKRFASRTVAAFESRYSPSSLDEKIFDDGEVTLVDRLECTSALSAFDDIRFAFEEEPDC